LGGMGVAIKFDTDVMETVEDAVEGCGKFHEGRGCEGLGAIT
jgi:hypothetical protein